MNSIAFLVVAAALGPVPDQVVAIKVGRAITVSGEDIEDATILIEAGKIRAIGRDLEVPRNARVVDKPRSVAMPGIVDVHSTVGLRYPNEILANVPFVSVLDGIDPSSPGLENSLRHGVTAVNCITGNATRFGGQGAVIRTKGRMVDELVIKSPSAMKISLEPAAGETRMGNMALLRRSFLDLYGSIRTLLADASGQAVLIQKPATEIALEALIVPRPEWGGIDWSKVPLDKVPERERAMVELVRGKLRAFIYCPDASDVFKAFELIDTNGLDATLVLGRDAWKLAGVLPLRKDLGPVVISPDLVVWETDPVTGAETRHVTPRVLHESGISFAVQAESDSAFHRGPYFSRGGAYHHWYQAARLVQHGIPRDRALAAITLVPARILGLDHRLGSLDAGKDADIAIFSGDPLDARSWVEHVFIEGEEVYSREKDPDLELLLKEPERTF